ncbi:MAG: alpha-amylase family glycosyl hydrolase, partial [Myxococcota bacterium]
FLDRLRELHFEWLYLLGIWSTGEASRGVSRSTPSLVDEYASTLPDFASHDVCGSPFAVTAYRVHPRMGGNGALARLRERARARDLRLMIDFVPNHVALDHPWRAAHPAYFIVDDARFESFVADGKRYAYGRDPFTGAWRDTLQLNYAEPGLVDEMVATVRRLSDLADGVRCDMAMLELPDVFEQTWGRRIEPFWPRAIAAARDHHPGFVFMAEVYWDREYQMQELGFDYTYDKAMYDRLLQQPAGSVRGHLHAEADYQRRSVRFLENHDEPRAAATFPLARHRAAAVLAYLVPGLRFFHDGQWEGRRVKISMHLCRRPDEPVDAGVAALYRELLAILRRAAPRRGQWQLLGLRRAWADNPSDAHFVAFSWQREDELLVAIVNDSEHRSQCYVAMPFLHLAGRPVVLDDLFGPQRYERDGSRLLAEGLYVDVEPWRAHVFLCSALYATEAA